MDTAYDVRPPRPDEAPEWTRIHLSSWRAAYAHLYDQAFFEACDAGAQARASRWATMFRGLDAHGIGSAGPGARARVLAAFDGARMAGIGVALEPWNGAVRELSMLYADPDYYGRGTGHRLMEHLLGEEPAVLWVFEDNPRARRFYERHGFLPDGPRRIEEVPEQPAHPALRLRRP